MHGKYQYVNVLCQIEPEIFLVFTFMRGKVHYVIDSLSPTLDKKLSVAEKFETIANGESQKP